MNSFNKIEIFKSNNNNNDIIIKMNDTKEEMERKIVYQKQVETFIKICDYLKTSLNFIINQFKLIDSKINFNIIDNDKQIKECKEKYDTLFNREFNKTLDEIIKKKKKK